MHDNIFNETLFFRAFLQPRGFFQRPDAFINHPACRHLSAILKNGLKKKHFPTAEPVSLQSRSILQTKQFHATAKMKRTHVRHWKKNKNNTTET